MHNSSYSTAFFSVKSHYSQTIPPTCQNRYSYLPEAAREAAEEIELAPNLAAMVFVILPIAKPAAVVSMAVEAAPTAAGIALAAPEDILAAPVPIAAVGIPVSVVRHVLFELCYHCEYDARCTKPVESATR